MWEELFFYDFLIHILLIIEVLQIFFFSVGQCFYLYIKECFTHSWSCHMRFHVTKSSLDVAIRVPELNSAFHLSYFGNMWASDFFGPLFSHTWPARCRNAPFWYWGWAPLLFISAIRDRPRPDFRWFFFFRTIRRVTSYRSTKSFLNSSPTIHLQCDLHTCKEVELRL